MAEPFPGSPTIRVDGEDLFPIDEPPGLTCRSTGWPTAATPPRRTRALLRGGARGASGGGVAQQRHIAETAVAMVSRLLSTPGLHRQRHASRGAGEQVWSERAVALGAEGQHRAAPARAASPRGYALRDRARSAAGRRSGSRARRATGNAKCSPAEPRSASACHGSWSGRWWITPAAPACRGHPQQGRRGCPGGAAARAAITGAGPARARGPGGPAGVGPTRRRPPPAHAGRRRPGGRTSTGPRRGARCPVPVARSARRAPPDGAARRQAARPRSAARA